MEEPLLQVRDLITAFDTEGGLIRAVDQVSFDIARGRTLGIVGESGCGKSVTAMSLVRLLPQPAGRILQGEVRFKGRDLSRLRSDELRKVRGNEIGVIFQEPMTALNPVQRIGKQLAECFLLHKGMNRRQAWEAGVEMLRLVKIPSPELRAGDYPHQLSGGMRQRVVIAMALACRPDLVIADEPTTALDVTVQAQILDLMKRLQAELGMSVILITHDLGVIAETCDEVLVMYGGRVVERAPVREIFARPRHAYTKGLLASIPRLETPRKSLLPVIPGMVASLRDFVPGCRFCQRMAREGPTLRERPPFLEVSPGHWVEACPICHVP
ncbi:MAG: ABC transporter ATP-binding protein [Verrucomicrobia bacterium]|nr:MAG: ABC transporter ATP-binding protein [Verrucomicrobiota bacterium]TAE86119.1 MAG: ABC transporter ATP-binding protein [Verrucomicrobiota bacterium]TAF23466.1 MAG: ABC transporter ATP-binding protein [Verrucomicrobiota bacterium]TAF40096.1 MAG: ABC transporter ATP-binding protein [Verrucomicrobiota bacterium]